MILTPVGVERNLPMPARKIYEKWVLLGMKVPTLSRALTDLTCKVSAPIFIMKLWSDFGGRDLLMHAKKPERKFGALVY
jgi:hypothetical protein